MAGKRSAQRGDRSHVDDRSSTRFDKFWNTVAAAEKRTEQIQRLGVLPYPHVYVSHPLILRNRPTCTVIQNVKLAIAGDGLLDGSFDTFFLRDIRFNEDRITSGLTHCLFAGTTELWFEFGNY